MSRDTSPDDRFSDPWPTAGGGSHDSDVEARLRRALTARAEIVTHDRLRAAAPPPAPAPRRWTPRVVGGLGLAAAAAAAVVLTVSSWHPWRGGVAEPGATAALASNPAPALSPTAAAATGVAATAPSVTSSGVANTASPEAPLCTPGQMSPILVNDSAVRQHGGGMNHQGATVAVLNTGAAPCLIRAGYPGVSMYLQDVEQSAPASSRGATWYATDAPEVRITLAPGQLAYAELSWTSADGVKPATAIDEVAVILPGQKTRLHIPFTSTLGGDRVITVTRMSQTLPTLKS